MLEGPQLQACSLRCTVLGTAGQAFPETPVRLVLLGLLASALAAGPRQAVCGAGFAVFWVGQT